MKKYKWIIVILLVSVLLITGVYLLQKEEPYISIWDSKNSSDWTNNSIIGTRNGKQFVVSGKKESKKYDEITYLAYIGNKVLFTSKDNTNPFGGSEYITIDWVEAGPYLKIKELNITESWEYSYITEKVTWSANNAVLTKDTLVINGKETASYDKIEYRYICSGNSVFKAKDKDEEFLVINGKEWPRYKKIDGFDLSNWCLPNGDLIYIGEKETPKWTTGTGTESEYTEYKISFDFLKNTTVLASDYKSMMHYWLDGKWNGNWFVTKDNHFAVPLEIDNWMPYEKSKWKIMIDWIISPEVYDAVFALSYMDDGTLKYAIVKDGYKDWVTVPSKN